MLGIESRAARWTWTAALTLLVIWLVYLVRMTLFIFVLAVLFAYLLSPLVNLLDRVLPHSRTRTPALLLAYVLVVGGAVFVGIEIGTRVVQQATELAQGLPTKLQAWLDAAPATVRDEVNKHLSEVLSELPRFGLQFLSVVSDLVYVIIIPVLSFLFLKEGKAIREHILDLVEPGPRRALLDDVLDDVHLLLGHYMHALFLLSLITLTAYGVFLTIDGVRFALLLAVLACLLEVIPMIGPVAAGAITLLVGHLTGSAILPILIFIVAFRCFQDYLVSPHMMGQGVELHPLLVLFGVFAGAELAGIAGTFLSVPVLALVRILYLRIRKVRLGVQLAPTELARP